MKLTKFKIVLIGIGVLAVAGGAYALTRGGSSQTFVTETVKKGNLSQTVEVTGELKSVSDLSLAFETSGTVTNIPVAIGDRVKAGDVLAELDTGELSASAEQARQSMLAAQADLDLKLAGISSEEEVAQRAAVTLAQAQVDAAQADVNAATIAQITGDSTDAATVASAQSDYDQVADENAEATAQASEDLHNALSSGLITARSGLQTADQVLGVGNTLLNDDYEAYLGLLDKTTMTDAKSAYEDAAYARDAAEDAVLALTSTSSSSDVLSAYSRVSTALSLTSNTLLYTSRVLDASVSNSGDFSNADLIALRSTIAAERTTVSSGISTLTAAKQTYDTALRQADNRLTDATNALALAKAKQDSGNASRESSVLQATASLAVQEASLAKAQAQLNQVLADPRAIDLAGLQASVGRAKADYTAALARLRKAQVVAPIDGVVTDIAYDVGEQVSAGVAMVSEIAGNDAYEIVLDVPEADISKLAVGQKADVTFDAFGDKVTFSGSVYSLNPAQKVISDVVFYEAKVLLSADQDVSMLKPGMSANVTMHTDDRENVLYVPTRSVLEKNGSPYVRVPQGANTFSEVSVVTGLKADDGLTEIVSGVTEGQNVIVTIKSN